MERDGFTSIKKWIQEFFKNFIRGINCKKQKINKKSKKKEEKRKQTNKQTKGKRRSNN